MNQYTREELNYLIDSFINFMDPETAGLNGVPVTHITIRGISNLISCDLLVKIVLNDRSLHINTGLVNIFKELYLFIHYVDIDDVPMYMNTMPEVAKWRLQIGK